MIKLQHLKAVNAIAEAGSFQRAARAMGLSQPALSKSILELERQLGAAVFIRSGRGVSLTEYGRVVLKRSRTVGREMEKLEEEVGFLKNQIAGKLTVGFTPLAGGPSLAGAIATFRQRYPAIELKLLELRPHEILEGVRNGSQDFGLITLYGKTSLPGFHTEIVHGLDTVLISGGPRPAGPLAIADLLHREWLDADVGDPATGYISTLMSGLGLPLPKRILRCSSIHLCARLAVELGAICGVTRIALPSLRSEIEAGALTPLDVTADLPRMNVALAFPDEELMSPAARELARLLRARFGGSRAPVA